MGFEPCKAEPNIWMHERDGIYEYIAVYIDDLAIISKDPARIIETLCDPTKANFKVKGSGPITFHLGCDFFRDEDGVLCFAPRKYVMKMVDSYKQMFGQAPSQKYSLPLKKGYHPKLDTSEFVDATDIQKYQSLIRSMQWVISLG